MSAYYNGNSSTAPTVLPNSSEGGRRNALRESLKIFHVDWMREHLLGDTSTTEACILSSPLQQMHSGTFETGLKFDPLDTSRVDCKVVSSSETVIVPAFSKDGMSAGYILAETYGVYSDELVRQNGVSMLRFIANEENGSYIGVVQRSNADILMQYTHTNCGSTFYYFTFAKNALHQTVMDALTDDVTVLENAVRSVFFAENACSRSSYFIAPKSPLDLFAVQHNIVQTQLRRVYRNGMYELFDNGVSKQVIPVQAQYRIGHIAKSGTAKRLLNWAIRDALGDTSIAVSLSIGSIFATDDVPDRTVNQLNFDLFDIEKVDATLSIIPNATIPGASSAGTISSVDLSFDSAPLPSNTAVHPTSAPIEGARESSDELYRSQPHTFPSPFVPLVDTAIPQVFTSSPNRRDTMDVQYESRHVA